MSQIVTGLVRQALALDVPLLMNRNIIGGWKYVNEKTGEFFNEFLSSVVMLVDEGCGTTGVAVTKFVNRLLLQLSKCV